MTGILADALGLFHRIAARSRICVLLSMKLRNQADAVVRARFSDGIEMSQNGELRIIARAAPDADFFIDVGANVGNWTGEFLKRMKSGGRGMALEPSPDAARELIRRLEADALKGRVDVLQSAAADMPGTKEFFMEPAGGETSSLIKQHSNRESVPIEVSVTTIDAEVDRRGIKYIDFLKVDAEGYDLKVIRGASLSLSHHLIGLVQFEYNRPWMAAGGSLAEAVELFEKCGYRVFLLKQSGLFDVNLEVFGDYYGYSNYIALSPQVVSKFADLFRGPL